MNLGEGWSVLKNRVNLSRSNYHEYEILNDSEAGADGYFMKLKE